MVQAAADGSGDELAVRGLLASQLRQRNGPRISDPETARAVSLWPWRPAFGDPQSAQVLFCGWPTQECESSDSGRLRNPCLGESLNDPDTHRKSGFELLANREWADGPETQAASGFAVI